MLITPDFVLLNQGNTGSTLARKVPIKNYRRRKNPLLSPLLPALKIESAYRKALVPQKLTGTRDPYSDLPPRNLQRPIVAFVRRPVEKLLFASHFQQWAKMSIQQGFPTYPKLPVPRYLQHPSLVYEDRKASLNVPQETVLGTFPRQLITMFSKDPAAFYAEGKQGPIRDAFILNKLSPQRLLRTESLNVALGTFILQHCILIQHLGKENQRAPETLNGADREAILAYVASKESLAYRIVKA